MTTTDNKKKQKEPYYKSDAILNVLLTLGYNYLRAKGWNRNEIEVKTGVPKRTLVRNWSNSNKRDNTIPPDLKLALSEGLVVIIRDNEILSYDKNEIPIYEEIFKFLKVARISYLIRHLKAATQAQARKTSTAKEKNEHRSRLELMGAVLKEEEKISKILTDTETKLREINIDDQYVETLIKDVDSSLSLLYHFFLTAIQKKHDTNISIRIKRENA